MLLQSNLSNFLPRFKIKIPNPAIMNFPIPSFTKFKKPKGRTYRVGNSDRNLSMILLIASKIKFYKRTSSMISFSLTVTMKEKFSKI